MCINRGCSQRAQQAFGIVAGPRLQHVLRRAVQAAAHAGRREDNAAPKAWQAQHALDGEASYIVLGDVWDLSLADEQRQGRWQRAGAGACAGG